MSNVGDENLTVSRCLLDEIIPLHFETVDHNFPLKQFIEVAQSAEAIVENFNQQFFEGKLNYKILVIPPEQGTFLEILGIAITGTASSAWVFLESDIGKAFVKGLSGHEPAYWGNKIGKRVGKKLNKQKKCYQEIKA
jgi:hypothetical protein